MAGSKPAGEEVTSNTGSDVEPVTPRSKVVVYDDGTNTFFWQAHTVTALILITAGLVYVALMEETTSDTGYNTRRGLIAVVVVFILIGIIHMPDGPFVRPHPALWRLVLCLIIIYVLLLIFVLFQTADDARQLLASFYPELGRPLPERSYAEDCTLYTPGDPRGDFHNFLDKIDVFVLCHFFGWIVKWVGITPKNVACVLSFLNLIMVPITFSVSFALN